MSEKCGIQGDENEADGRNTNQEKRDRNSKERFKRDEDESTSDSSDVKKMKKSSLISTIMLLWRKGVNRVETVIVEQTPDVTENNQSVSLDKTVEIHRNSTRNKK